MKYQTPFYDKNPAEVHVTPALGKVTGVQNLGQGHRFMGG